MKVAITGSSGLIGTALRERLLAEGHQVLRLVRRPAAEPDETQWDPVGRQLDPQVLADVDAVVNLAGVGISDRRWNKQHLDAVRTSRIDATSTISSAVARAGTPVLLSGSAVGWYGDTGDREADESTPGGTGVLADICTAWEGATAPALDAGARVAFLRTGLILSRAGGMMGRVRPLFAAGAGGRLGSGSQYWPWISLVDEIGAIIFLLTEAVNGPVNLTGPVPVTNAEFTHTLSRLMNRPAVLPVPATALRIALGGFADEGVLISQRVVPRVLEREGFRFSHSTLERALSWALGKPHRPD